MSKDPFAALGERVLLTDYVDVLVQLEKGTGTRPVLWLLKDSFDTAVSSMNKLIEIDATETDAIRSLQQEVRLFHDMMESCQRMLIRGKAADREIDESERREFAEMLTPEAAREMGLEPPPEDA